MKHEEDIRMSLSPPMSTDAASMYARLFSGNPSAMNMLTPQLMAANRNAAALMASQLPMSMRASLAATNYFPHHHHPGFLGTWPSPSSNASPPISPISPSLSVKSVKKINNNNNIVSTTTEVLPKKATKRKTVSIKKEPISPSITAHSHPLDLPITHDHMSPGPISPPTSGSSPQSNGSIDNPPLLPTSTKDPTRDKCFTCNICSRSFGYKHVLQNHERTHTGEKPFECPECKKRFTRDHHLKTHMRLHTGEKPYHCSHCDRHFVQVANLRRHLRVHTGERPYTCEICKAKFSDSNQLKAHVLIHNGEKPFRCDRCQARFRRRHHLVHHKCGITSPPMSPSMSLSDNKSSDASDLSMDLSKLQYSLDSPLDLKIEDGHDLEKRNRKSQDVRRILRMPPQIPHLHTVLPEQTEPEDLSMHSPRSNISHDEDLDDLDDAATLYIKQRQRYKPPKRPNNLKM